MKKSEPYLRAINLLGVEEILSRHGHSLEPLLVEFKIPISAMNELDSLVSFSAAVAMLEAAAFRFKLPNLGMEIVHQNSPEFPNLGPLLTMAKFVNIVEEWVETALRYWKYHTNGFTAQLINSESDQTATLRYIANPFDMPYRQFIEATFGNIVGLARVATERIDENPLIVRFQHRKPENTQMLEDHFRCPLEFGQLHSEIIFDRGMLKYKTSGSMRLFKPLMRIYMTERLRRLDTFNRSTEATVALVIPCLLGTGNCNIVTIAEVLNRTPKKLQRQLADENTNYSEIIEAVRLSMSKHLLADTDAPISRIAGYLDYGSTPPFSLAFRRWTGQTPLGYRKRNHT